MNRYLTVFWFRRDLRIEDNRGLYEALSMRKTTRCVFIYDKEILDDLSDKADKRVSFLHERIRSLRGEFNRHGSDLWVYYGDVEEIFEKMLRIHPIANVVVNEDFEPYGISRDVKVQKICDLHGVGFTKYTDHLIFHPGAIVKDDGLPYQVFTAYKNKWLHKLEKSLCSPYRVQSLLSYLQHCGIGPKEILLNEMGFERVSHSIGDMEIDAYKLKNYALSRDYPSLNGTSRLSVHLRFGTVSIREVVKKAEESSEIFLSELIWREFFMMILYFHPSTVTRAFKPAYDKIAWRNDKKEFKMWCEGKTGYPIVDAGMHELNETGFMHNRVRMIVASFLCKHLLIDWRWGEAYFAGKLNDFELSSNVGNWQWAAGSGCDAAPYFRIFNPFTQAQKFDSDGVYVKKWNEGNDIGLIVDHDLARNRCLQAYKKGLADS